MARLTYVEAAKRVGRTPRAIRYWRRNGMPMTWEVREGQRTRVVDEDVLLTWFRKSLQANPVHQLRMRARRAADLGVPASSLGPVRSVGSAAAQARADAGPMFDGSSSERSEDSTFPSVPRPVDPLADMRPLRGGPEYFMLREAMEDEPAGCAGFDAFTADHVDPETVPLMESICAACPLLELCRAFAEVNRPDAGFWAGAPASSWRKGSQRKIDREQDDTDRGTE